MLIGVFADAHDHVDNLRRAVAEFNREGCELVVFAGDFVTPLAVPPLRKLNCPLIACFGDADGNKPAIEGGMRIIGPVGEPPLCVRTADGTRLLVTHKPEPAGDLSEGADVIISAHTHKPSIRRDEAGRLFVNPGETAGWMFRKPTVALLETKPLEARIVSLPEMPTVTGEE
jgi:putative phosphoesterase